MSDACPDCGAPLTSSTRYGWGTYRTYKCGKVVDDGPGRSCPHAEASWRAYNLTKLGDPCDWQEAEGLTEDQYAHRLAVAKKAHDERVAL